MEKEMKKLLLVAVSVGVFLLVTITVAIVVLTPKAQPQETAFSSSIPMSHGRNIPDIMSNMPAQIEIPPAPVINDRSSEEINMIEMISPIEPDRNDGERLTIQIPRPTSAAVPDVSASVPTVTRQPAAPQPVVQPSAQPTQTAARPATQPAARTAPATRAINDYWIQAGAFSAMVRAEDAKELLASKGLISIIENRVIDGRTWYRVRLGPYTSEREANHWLAIVKAIDGFNDSQVRQTVRQQ